MLAERRTLVLNGIEIADTPILVPSFSSKGIPEDVDKTIKWASEFIDASTLVSAYDIAYKKIIPPFTFPSLIFLDSGGYEASKDSDLSELGEREHLPKLWTQAMHEEQLAKWHSNIPTVFISYDHPKERLSVQKQIERARKMASSRTDVLREILLKPETKGQNFLQIKNILKHIAQLKNFDVIGVTEKEVGNSVLARMTNIAKLRKGLTEIGLKTPIHVFGSLDTVTTLMYFVAGADIFDGLTWLRFAYQDGQTIYRHSYGAMKLGIDTKSHLVDAQCWTSNLNYLKERQLEMRRFLNAQDFRCFKYHANDIKKAQQSVIANIGGGNGW
jgi:hypothetical protein